MKKKYLFLGSMALLNAFTRAQSPKEPAVEKISKTEIELVYKYYSQDGNNSAVTGGIGTEELTVYGPMFYLKRTVNNKAIAINFGTDLITSSSTDKIDAVMSSSSLHDSHTFVNATYFQNNEKKGITLYSGLGFSIESDYLSINGKLGIEKKNLNAQRIFSAEFQMYQDDLRWGRLNGDYKHPVKLIYPAELRTREWYSTYKRNSYNCLLGFTQIINQRNVLGIFPQFTLQNGLLETPFHRVYFSDHVVSVEQLPEQRFKQSLAIKLNTFVGGNIILKNKIESYSDSFGVNAIGIENETAIKLRNAFTLLPNARFYAQTASRYFKKYEEHEHSEEFYTSDFDLSKLQTWNVGMGIRFSPQAYISKRVMFNTMLLRYNYLSRSNHLTAHIISISLQTTFNEYGKK